MSASMAAGRYFTVLFRRGGIVGKARSFLADFAAISIDAAIGWRSEQGRLIVALVPISSSAPRARSLASAATVKSMPSQQHRGPAGQIR